MMMGATVHAPCSTAGIRGQTWDPRISFILKWCVFIIVIFPLACPKTTKKEPPPGGGFLFGTFSWLMFSLVVASQRENCYLIMVCLSKLIVKRFDFMMVCLSKFTGFWVPRMPGMVNMRYIENVKALDARDGKYEIYRDSGFWDDM